MRGSGYESRNNFRITFTSFDNLRNKDKKDVFQIETQSIDYELTAQLATQLSTAEYEANKPAYVDNLPIKADSDEKLDTSSDGRNDDIFPQDYFAAPLKYFRLLPKEEKLPIKVAKQY